MNIRLKLQDFHYNRYSFSPFFRGMLLAAEFFYKSVICFKNYLYEKNILKEKKTELEVICIGNLTTGGVGKTPLVIEIANTLSAKSTEPSVAIISRGYRAKLNNKIPSIIKDKDGIKFSDGRLCGDEVYQIAKKTHQNVMVITCKNRIKAIELAKKMGIKTVILDDGFSNRAVKKDRAIILVDSKMIFGNGHLLPYGPLREPLEELKRADEFIIVDKSSNEELVEETKEKLKQYNKKIRLCKVEPKRIYNMLTKAEIKQNSARGESKKENAVAFCAIGQAQQFFEFAKRYYNLCECVKFFDHYEYKKADIERLIALAKERKASLFITTQKDETKIKKLIRDDERFRGFSFNVLELKTELCE